MKLHNIRHAINTKPPRPPPRQRPRHAMAFLGTRLGFMHTLMDIASLKRKPVLREHALEADERALARVKNTLQAGQRQQVFVVCWAMLSHGRNPYSISITSTPDGQLFLICSIGVTT